MSGIFGRPRRSWRAGAVAAAVLAAVAGAWTFWSASATDDFTVAVVRAPLVVTITETGTLRPADAISYRSHVQGREVEVTWLAPEGAQVADGDVIARLDTAELQSDLLRATQALRQAQLDLQVAEADRQAAASSLASLSNGRGSLDAEEARFNAAAAERKVERLRQQDEMLAPLLEQGFVTREELDRAAGDLEEARGAAELARRRADILTQQSLPQERQRLTLDVSHRTAQVEAVRQRVVEASTRIAELQATIDSCTIRAQRAGLVVYDQNLSSSPPRKIRVGDRVTPSQGLVTIPEVRRMLADISIREADVHRLHQGQPATITLEAYPGARLTGHVRSVGAVAHAATDRPDRSKRFDVVVDVDPSSVELRPEMTATVRVEIASRPDALVVPLNAVFDRGDRHFVTVVTARGRADRAVTLGVSNDSHAEVLGGLKEGERVRLGEAAPASAVQ